MSRNNPSLNAGRERGRSAPALAPHFEVGARVRVPKFAVGTVLAVAGDQVTIVFADRSIRTFLADYVALA